MVSLSEGLAFALFAPRLGDVTWLLPQLPLFNVTLLVTVV